LASIVQYLGAALCPVADAFIVPDPPQCLEVALDQWFAPLYMQLTIKKVKYLPEPLFPRYN
jgi:hypothetical protein